MKIARKDGLVSVAPYFPMLKEGNVRTGFVEPPQFKELLGCCISRRDLREPRAPDPCTHK
jgi:hypothetical protein